MHHWPDSTLETSFNICLLPRDPVGRKGEDRRKTIASGSYHSYQLVPSHLALIWYQHLPLLGGKGLAEVKNNVGCANMAILGAGLEKNGRQVGIGRKGWFQICPVQIFPLLFSAHRFCPSLLLL